MKCVTTLIGAKKKLVNKPLRQLESWTSIEPDSLSDAWSTVSSDHYGEFEMALANSATHSEQKGLWSRPLKKDDLNCNSGDMISEGSPTADQALHLGRKCKPCLFHFSHVGCRDVDQCTFCHLQHGRGIWKRPSKGKRDMIKQAMATGNLEKLSQKEV